MGLHPQNPIIHAGHAGPTPVQKLKGWVKMWGVEVGTHVSACPSSKGTWGARPTPKHGTRHGSCPIAMPHHPMGFPPWGRPIEALSEGVSKAPHPSPPTLKSSKSGGFGLSPLATPLPRRLGGLRVCT